MRSKARAGRVGGRAPYEYWVLHALVEAGGQAKTAWVCDYVFDKMRSEIGPREREHQSKSGEITWRNEVKWARKDMIEDGRMTKVSPRGVWKITEAGRDWLKAHPNPPKLGKPRIEIDEDW
jgi:restriction system protein